MPKKARLSWPRNCEVRRESSDQVQRRNAWSVILIVLTILFVFGFGHAQPGNNPVDALKAAINGSSYEVKSADGLDSYSYDAVSFEQCSLTWTETRESRQRDLPTLRELSETRLPLNLLDLTALKVERLKSSGFLVPLLTKGLRPVITSHQRTQWGDDPPMESVTEGKSGSGFYFRDREAAERVSTALASLARSCRKE